MAASWAVRRAGQMVHSRFEMWVVAKAALKARTMAAPKADSMVGCWVACSVRLKADSKAAGWVGCSARCSAAQTAAKKAELKAPSSVAMSVDWKAQSSADL